MQAWIHGGCVSSPPRGVYILPLHGGVCLLPPSRGVCILPLHVGCISSPFTGGVSPPPSRRCVSSSLHVGCVMCILPLHMGCVSSPSTWSIYPPPLRGEECVSSPSRGCVSSPSRGVCILFPPRGVCILPSPPSTGVCIRPLHEACVSGPSPSQIQGSQCVQSNSAHQTCYKAVPHPNILAGSTPDLHRYGKMDGLFALYTVKVDIVTIYSQYQKVIPFCISTRYKFQYFP